MKDRIIKPNVDTRVNDELAFHIEMHTRELIVSGVAPDEARRQAEASLGDRKRVAQECLELDRDIERTERRTQYLSELLQDARFAVRMLTRRRTFAAIAVLTLALGIGAATAIYSVVDGVLLRPLPFGEPDRVAAVWITQPELAKNPAVAWLAEATPVGNEEYQAFRSSAKTLGNIAMWSFGTAYMDGPNGMENATLIAATSSVLPTLRVSVALGRGFLPDEDRLDGPRVALVSWEAWHLRYNGDSAVLGKSVMLDWKPFTIVGVLPRGLRLDRTQDAAAFWIPALRDSSDLPERHNRNYRALGRLASGENFAGATTELTRIMRTITGDSTTGARVEQWQRDESRKSREALFILLGAAVLLLGIACVNVAVLFLGESANRSREMAARAALGAGSGRLARQLLVESLVLAIVSALLGSALAWALTRGLVALAPKQIPGLSEVGMNLRVLSFAVSVATITGLIFGIAPALAAGRTARGSLTRVGVGQSARSSVFVQRGLIAAQLALSMLLLTDASLLVRSLNKLMSTDPGFSSAQLSVVRVTMPWNLFRDDNRTRAVVSDIQRRFAGLPGVERVVTASSVPFAGGASSSPVLTQKAANADPNTRGTHTQQRYVGDGYFEVLGLRMVRGRAFNAQDIATSEPVAIISESAAKRDFATAEPIGELVRHQGKWRRIVGIVADIKYAGLAETYEPTIYVPFDHHPSTYVRFIVRHRGELSIPAYQRVMREADPNTIIVRADPLPALVANSYSNERYRTVLVSAFGIIAALLAAVGMYGVSTRAVARRTREVGIRLALGSSNGAIQRLMVGDAMHGVVLGLMLGIPATLALGFVIQPFLFDVNQSDFTSYASTAVLLGIVTFAASYIPSRRASRTDPATVLRGD